MIWIGNSGQEIIGLCLAVRFITLFSDQSSTLFQFRFESTVNQRLCVLKMKLREFLKVSSIHTICLVRLRRAPTTNLAGWAF